MRAIAVIIAMTAILLTGCSSYSMGNNDIVRLDISSETFVSSSRVVVDIPSHTMKLEYQEYTDESQNGPKVSVKNLDENEQASIIEVIQLIDFNKMKNKYENLAVVDGVKLQVIVERKGCSKKVIFNNFVTLDIYALVNYINGELSPEAKLSSPRHFVSP